MNAVSGPDGAVLDLMVDKAPYNNAYDSMISRVPAKVFEWAAQPLIDHIYGPIAEKNHILGVIAINATLTAPRIPLEYKLGKIYESALDEGKAVKAALAIGGKLATKAVDGLDGPVARGTDCTTEFGAVFDPLTDMLGTLDDAVIIMKRAKAEKDYVTVALMGVRLAVDVGVIATSSVNLAAQKKLESKGVEVPEREKAKALAMGKVKFGAGVVGDTVLLSSYNTGDLDKRHKAKRAGQTITVASIVAGGVSIYQYGRAAAKKLRQLKDLKQQAA